MEWISRLVDYCSGGWGKRERERESGDLLQYRTQIIIFIMKKCRERLKYSLE